MIALFFDTETTGFKHGDFIPEIVQIGALLQDTDSMRVLAELNMIVKPEKPIPQQVSAIHGITDELAAAYGFGSRIAKKAFCDMAFMAETIVAHNISFDMGIIKDAWPLTYDMLNVKIPFCTMRQSTNILQLPKNGNAFHNNSGAAYKYPKLIECYQHFFNGQSFENAHDAMADVRACRDIYFALQAVL